MTCVAIFMFGYTYESEGQNLTNGYRDFYENCETKVTGSINGVSVNISTTGSKNNCQKSDDNSCGASGCKSQVVETIVNKILK